MSLRSSAILCALAFVASTGAQVTVRVATLNLQGLDPVGSAGWTAAVSVVARTDADVVALEEVEDAESGTLGAFAAAAGYAHFALGSNAGTLSGGLRLAVLSRWPISGSISHSAVSLSGDPLANDIGRSIFEARIQVPGGSDVLGIFVLHLKAGSTTTDRFRRALEVMRLQQALAAFRAAHPGAPHLVTGDFNEDLADGPFGNSFASAPSGLPASFRVGSDVTFPVIYDPFVEITGTTGTIADATQEDSSSLFTTRPSSGRRLDYLITFGPLTNLGDEVYNSSRDNGVDDLPLGNWLPKAGAPLAAVTSTAASDHFAVFGDFGWNTVPPPPSMVYVPGDVVVSEFLPDPTVVNDSFGEWLELRNTTSATLALQGFVIRDQGTDGFQLPSLSIPPRGFLVLAANGNPAQNGGLTPDFVWPSGSMFLANTSDEIEVVTASGLVLDSVVYGGAIATTSGRSVERLDASATAQPSNFGAATTVFGGGDRGTPGQVNSLDIGPVFTAITVSGSLQPGTTAFLNVLAPFSQANRPYLLGAATCATPGLPLGPSGRVLDLCFDDLLVFSATPGNGLFNGFAGSLNALGLASANFVIPNEPALTGFSFWISGVVLEPSAPEGIASVMDHLRVTIL